MELKQIKKDDYSFLLGIADIKELLHSDKKEGLLSDLIKYNADPEIKFNELLYYCLGKTANPTINKNYQFLLNNHIQYFNINKFVDKYIYEYNFLKLFCFSPIKENINNLDNKTKGLLILKIINDEKYGPTRHRHGLDKPSFDSSIIKDCFINFEMSPEMINMFAGYYCHNSSFNLYSLDKMNMLDFYDVFFAKIKETGLEIPPPLHHDLMTLALDYLYRQFDGSSLHPVEKIQADLYLLLKLADLDPKSQKQIDAKLSSLDKEPEFKILREKMESRFLLNKINKNIPPVSASPTSLKI